MPKSKQESLQEIAKLVDRYQSLTSRDIKGYSEADTRRVFIIPLFHALSWDVYSREEEVEEVKAAGGRPLSPGARSQKNRGSRSGIGRRCMSALEKAMVLALLAKSSLTKSQTLAEIGTPRRTYYNWVKQKKAGGKKSENRRPWNRIKAKEEKLVIDHARVSPELSPRQLCLKLVDDYGCWISKSTVYRVLKKCGLPTAAI